MSTRDEVFADTVARNARRRADACRVIGDAPTASEARSELKRAVRTLPGVADDPDTVEDILRYVDIYVSRTTRTDVSADTARPDNPDVRVDRCWIGGVHRRHTWTACGQRYLCAGQIRMSTTA
jgi:hypothetical protein